MTVCVLGFGVVDRVVTLSKESVLNVEPPLDLNEYSMKAQAMFQTKMEAKAKESEAAGQAALDEAAKVEGAVTTDSGLVFLSTEAGSGDKPKASDSVKVDSLTQHFACLVFLSCSFLSCIASYLVSIISSKMLLGPTSTYVLHGKGVPVCAHTIFPSPCCANLLISLGALRGFLGGRHSVRLVDCPRRAHRIPPQRGNSRLVRGRPAHVPW